MSAMGQLGAGIAHEVKNPLASIRGYAQLGLRKVPKDHPLAEYFQTVEKETGRWREILKNLLNVARQETAEMSRIELNAVVAETIKLVKHPLGMRKVHVEAKQCSEPLHVVGNANQIEQVLLNLFMNAGDAMEEMKGGTLTVTTDLVDGSARIRSTDTGCGIPQEKISKIFNPFFTTKPVGKGTGLGLSVSYGIIKEHKGDVTVQSEVGKGTTFNILIPLAAEEKAQAPMPAVEKKKPVGVISLK
jgi:two-component system NtrC family sensor kinase